MKKLPATILISSLFLFFSCSKKDFKVEPTDNISTGAQTNSGVSSVISPSTIEEAKTAHIAKRQITQKSKFSLLAQGIVDDIKEIKTIKKNGLPFFSSYLDGTHTEYIYNTTRLLDQNFST